jgi:hypothetical protein
MTTQYDQANWLLTDEHQKLTIIFFEPAGVAAVYLAIYRITNESEFDIIVTTAHGTQLLLPANRKTPSSLDVSSTRVDLSPARPLEKGASAAGTYQDICCSLAQSSMAITKITSPPVDNGGA